MFITASKLRRTGACRREVHGFQEIFPRGAHVTKQNLDKAVLEGLPVFWIQRFLSDEVMQQLKVCVKHEDREELCRVLAQFHATPQQHQSAVSRSAAIRRERLLQHLWLMFPPAPALLLVRVRQCLRRVLGPPYRDARMRE